MFPGVWSIRRRCARLDILVEHARRFEIRFSGLHTFG